MLVPRSEPTPAPPDPANTMSLDSSLKSGNALATHRNVLSRAERIQKLQSLGKFDAKKGQKPLGLPKVGNRKLKAGK
jgi:small basic protein (TIGR04137 family)